MEEEIRKEFMEMIKLLEEGRLYTVSEAEEVINRYMTRKV